MRVLVTGANGQVGAELRRSVWPPAARVTFLSHEQFDISAPCAVSEKITPPLDLVINTAAYTAVDRAEAERELASRVNSQGAELLARRCAVLGIPLIHISTDYIFDGSKGAPYTEDDVPSPLNVYGASKLGGEALVRATGCAHIIVRTASVFGQFGQNFVKAMLRLGAERNSLGIVADQFSCPTPAADIAALLVQLAERVMAPDQDQAWGIYHFCGQPPVTWFDFAQEIFRVAHDCGITAPELRLISAAEYPGAARRPGYSALDCSKIVGTFGCAVPSWSARLPQVISGLLGRRLVI